MIDNFIGYLWIGFDALFETPEFRAAMVTYPLGMLIGIYWTQGLKRSQYKRYLAARKSAIAWKIPFSPPRKFTSFELQSISALAAAGIISIMTKAFFHAPNDQIMAHAVIGGALAPAGLWLAIKVCEWKCPEMAARLKKGDRRKAVAPIATDDRREPDPSDTGQFWDP